MMGSEDQPSTGGVVKPLSRRLKDKVRSECAITSVSQCVEELLYNAIDAGSTKISIGINPALFRIEVEDNGCGISKTDLELIGKRHVTSKLLAEEDFRVPKSYGYRGEALASIVTVSTAVVIVSHPMGGSDKVYRRAFRGGIPSESGIKEVKQVKKPRPGLTITVDGLLEKQPVRQKRIDMALQLEEVKTSVEKIALVNPRISIELRDDSSLSFLLKYQPRLSYVEAFDQLFSAKKKNYFQFSSFQYLHSGFAFNSSIGKQTFRLKCYQLVFVNKRWIQGKTRIHKRLNDALVQLFQNEDPTFKSKGSEKTYPVFIVDIQCSMELYSPQRDSKFTVDFYDSEAVQEAVDGLVLKFQSIVFPNSVGNNVICGKNNGAAVDFKKRSNVLNVAGVVQSGIMSRDNLFRKDKRDYLDTTPSPPAAKKKKTEHHSRCSSRSSRRTPSVGRDSGTSITYSQLEDSPSACVQPCGRSKAKHTVYNIRRSVPGIKKVQTTSKPKKDIIVPKPVVTKNIFNRFPQWKEATATRNLPPTRLSKFSRDPKFQSKIQQKVPARQRQVKNETKISESQDKVIAEQNDTEEAQFGWKLYRFLSAVNSCDEKNRVADNVDSEEEDCRTTSSFSGAGAMNTTKKTTAKALSSQASSSGRGHLSTSRISSLVPLPSTQGKSKTLKVSSGSVEVDEEDKERKYAEIETAFQEEADRYVKSHKVFNPSLEYFIVEDLNRNNEKTNGTVTPPPPILEPENLKKAFPDNIDSSHSSLPPLLEPMVTFPQNLNPATVDGIPGPVSTSTSFPFVFETSNEGPSSTSMPTDLFGWNEGLTFPQPVKSFEGKNDAQQLGFPSTVSLSNMEEKERSVEENMDIDWENWQFEVVRDAKGYEWLQQSENGRPIFINLMSGEMSYDMKNIAKRYKRTAGGLTNSNQQARNWLRRFFPKACDNLCNNNESVKPLAYGVPEAATNHLSKQVKELVIRNVQDVHTNHEKWRSDALTSASKYFGGLSDEVQDKNEDEESPYFKEESPSVCPTNKSRNVDAVPVGSNTISRNFSFKKDDLQTMQVVSQWDNKFIVANMTVLNFGGEGASRIPKNVLVVLDQHAAHERIRLEQLLNDLYEIDKHSGVKRIVPARIDPPYPLNLSETETRILTRFKQCFFLLGLNYEMPDPQAKVAKISEGPRCLVKKAAAETDFANNLTSLRTMLLALIQEEVCRIVDTQSLSSTAIPKTIFTVLCSQACRGAIKFGDSLSLDQCNSIVNCLKNCKTPFQCAHGRPSIAPLLDLNDLKSVPSCKSCAKEESTCSVTRPVTAYSDSRLSATDEPVESAYFQ